MALGPLPASPLASINLSLSLSFSLMHGGVPWQRKLQRLVTVPQWHSSFSPICDYMLQFMRFSTFVFFFLIFDMIIQLYEFNKPILAIFHSSNPMNGKMQTPVFGCIIWSINQEKISEPIQIFKWCIDYIKPKSKYFIWKAHHHHVLLQDPSFSNNY